MKARVYCLGLLLFCSACAAPSLRYKKEVNQLLVGGQFQQAAVLLEEKKQKVYSQKDATLLYLDQAALRHDAHETVASDQLFAQAQQNINDLYAKSLTGSLGQLLINDLTTPYYASPYEQAFTYYYRGLNFLQKGDLSSAAVEARRAVFFLDHLRGSKSSGYNDDPFVQYFASLVFESVGELSSARIARQNAFNAYARFGGRFNFTAPEFYVPSNANSLGEVVVFHHNGLLPLKKTQTVQVAWDRLLVMASSPQENSDTMAPEVANAISAAWVGNAVTISFPSLELQPYRVVSSWVEAGGQRYYTQKVADLAASLTLDLEEKMPGILFRTATRAVVKQVAAEQARQAVRETTEETVWGDLAGALVSVLGTLTEKADTRHWFTLPAEIRMTRIFLVPGNQNIRMLFRDGYGNIVGEHVFENVPVRPGGRVYLYHRTAY